MRITADQVFKAIGQTLMTDAGLTLEGRKIAVDANGRTSRKGFGLVVIVRVGVMI